MIDPVGAIFTLLVFEFIVLKQHSESYTHLFWTLGITVAVGLAIGALFGYLLGLALRRVWLPRYLQNLAVLAIMLTAFGVSNAIADESGLLTVTVMGIWLANMRDVDTSDILAFKEELSAILISALFIILAARLDIHALWNMGWPLLACCWRYSLSPGRCALRCRPGVLPCIGAIACCCAGSPHAASSPQRSARCSL
ncbi:potassium/proton antiporter [Serratia plymuthica]|uniref:Potassium/proton antiporter n=1 Tax=Serratia plymuthica TaxID=82996 RepID=A0A2X4VGR2_SERPL|nr:potassium/proton antiporter [Serratia plymuthica]